MKFKLHSMDEHTHPIYHSQSSSTYSYFPQPPIRAGFPSGNYGGGGPEMLGGHLETREAIQREIEKQKIREEIIAEEIARRRILEEEVRNELRMEREMMMSARSGGGFSSPFMPPLSPPPKHNHVFESRILHRQPIGLEERIVMSLEEKYVHGGRRRQIRGLEGGPFQRFSDPPRIKEIPTRRREDTKKEVVVLGKPKGVTLCGTKRKPTPSMTSSSSESRSDKPKKKVIEEWSCAICQVSATSESALHEHLQGKKHQTKEAALIAEKNGANFGLGVAPKKPIIKPVKVLTAVNIRSSDKNKKKSKRKKEIVDRRKGEFDLNDSKKKDAFKFWCEMCKVGAFSEKVMTNHKEGKRHLTNLDLQKSKVESEAPETEEKTETETNKVEEVKDDVEDVKVIAEEADNIVGDNIKTGVAEIK